MEEKEVLTIEELAQLLRVSKRTALKLVQTGQVRGSRVGRQWRVLKEEVYRFLERGGTAGVQEAPPKQGDPTPVRLDGGGQ